MDYGMAGEDAALDEAVAKIATKLSGGSAPQRDDRPINLEQDLNEYDGPTDLEELERDAADEAAAPKQVKKQPAAEAATEDQGKEGEDAGAEDDTEFFELPAEAEGQEPVKIPKAEAIEAVKAFRQMNGDIANAINKAEETYQKEQDGIIGDLVKAHDVVIDRAEAALRMMPRPQMPSDLLLDPNSQYYNPEQYHVQKLNYDRQLEVLSSIKAERDRAVKERDDVKTAQESIHNAREHERLGRAWGDDWKDPAKREAKVKTLTEGVQKHFGITPDLLAQVPFDHRIMQLVAFALEAKGLPAKQAEVRKAIQSKAPKIVNGQAPQRDSQGRFAAGEYQSARKELKETGSEDAFVRAFLAKRQR